MTRRVELPGAAELFRPTGVANDHLDGPVPDNPVSSAGTGRRKHEAKITVYLSDEELLALEQARLALLADFTARGADSQLVRGILGESVS